MSRCKSCHATVIWGRTAKGKKIPLNLPATPDGTFIFDDGEARAPGLFDAGKPRYTPHWATCPDADAWRKNDG